MLNYSVKAWRDDASVSTAVTKAAQIRLDTGVSGREDAFNPAELLLASVAACMIKSIERVAPLLKFQMRGVEISLRAVRQDSPPKLGSVEYEIVVDTDETDHALDLLHSNVRKFGTISNTIAESTSLTGTLRRKPVDVALDAEAHQAEIERVAKWSRQQLEAIAEPGTDPLHEGP